MYSAELIQQLYDSALLSAAAVETPDGLRIVCTLEMYMSSERHPVLLYRSAIRLMDPDFDGSDERAEKMATYLNRVSRYPAFAEMVKRGRGNTVRRDVHVRRAASGGAVPISVTADGRGNIVRV